MIRAPPSACDFAMASGGVADEIADDALKVVWGRRSTLTSAGTLLSQPTPGCIASASVSAIRSSTAWSETRLQSGGLPASPCP